MYFKNSGGKNMAFDLESLGGGFGSGLIATIAGLLGINRKINRLEDAKQEKGICDAIHKSIDDKFCDIAEMRKEIKTGQEKIWERLDNLNDYMRDRRKGYD